MQDVIRLLRCRQSCPLSVATRLRCPPSALQQGAKMGKGGVGVMRDKDEAAAADAGADASGGAAAAEQPADAGASMAPDVSAVGPADGGGGVDESSLYDGSGRLVVNLEMFRDDNFVQVGKGPSTESQSQRLCRAT